MKIMKKQSIYALMSAIALSGAIGFSSCSSTEEDNVPVNPGYNPETGEVPVEFLFKVSTSTNNSSTRMSGNATQASGNTFRGISDTKLFSFVQTESGKQLLNPDLPIGRRYDLSELVTANQIDATNSHRVIEMAFPLNTNTLVLYGRATSSAVETPYSLEESFGSLEDNAENATAAKLSDLTFSVKRRLDSDAKATYHNVEKLLAGILTCIMSTNCSRVPEDGILASNHPNNVELVPIYKFTVQKENIWGDADHQISWESYATTFADPEDKTSEKRSPYSPTHALYPLEEKLSNLYIEMTTIQGDGGELRAASGEDLLKTINDLWSVVNEVRCATPLNVEETVAKYLAAEIHNNFMSFFTASSIPTEPGPVSGVSFKSTEEVKTAFDANDFWPTSTAGEKQQLPSISLPGGKNLSTFPGCYNIPKGATHVKFDKTKKIYEYPATFNTSGVGNVDFTVNDYLFCPELIYYGNSPIRVSDTEYKPNQYPQGVSNWDNESNWAADWNDNYVKSSTRSVAMKYDINYGTALLETKVKYGASVLKDNNHYIQKQFHPGEINDYQTTEGEYNQEPDKKITVNGNSFQLVGVVVGGQSRNVGWDFLPKKVGTTPAYEYGFVYDSAIPTEAQKIPEYGSTSSPNYTLLFDNYDESIADDDIQNSVYVALEFKNNSGQDFFGNYNLIRDGGHFYLIGLLDLTSGAFNWPTGSSHILPPYNSDGTSKKIKRVFMQDYVTKVNFVIGENSLKYAYLTSPDLRSTSLRLGLSVDIQWSAGIDFGEVNMGGTQY